MRADLDRSGGDGRAPSRCRSGGDWVPLMRLSPRAGCMGWHRPSPGALPMTPAQPSRPRGAIVVIGVIVLAVAIAGAAGLWYLFFRPAGPAPVSLASLPAVTASPSATGTATAVGADPSTDPAASEDPAATTATAAGIAGSWTVDPSVGSRRHRHVRRVSRPGDPGDGRRAGGRWAHVQRHRDDDDRRHHHHRRRHHRRPDAPSRATRPTATASSSARGSRPGPTRRRRSA